MKGKKIVVAVGIVLAAIVAVFFVYFQKGGGGQGDILTQTNIISQEYVKLRYQTNELLVGADKYPNYEAWNAKMNQVIMRWENLEAYSSALKTSAENESEKISFRPLGVAHAYTAREITEIYDSAPPRSTGIKPIIYLADQLGTDAKKAFEILKIAQAQMESEAWDEAGDTFEILQNSAQTISTTCKVVVYVGGAVLSSGATTAVGAVLSGASMVVSGADLVLEIGETTSKVAAGYNSDAVAFFEGIRDYTAPAVAIIGFGSTFYDYGNWDQWGRVSAILFTGDQITSLLAENKIAGVETDKIAEFIGLNFAFKPEAKVEAVVLDKEETEEWLADNNINTEPEDPQKILRLDDSGNGIAQAEPPIVDEEGQKLSQEQIAELENKQKFQDEMAELNSQLAARIANCYGQQTETQTPSGSDDLEAQRQNCVDDCKRAQKTQTKQQVCSTTDSQYPEVAAELDRQRNQCKQRCKPQYDYLVKIEQQYKGSSEAKSARLANLKEWLANCPELCEKIHSCIALRTLSEVECENGCRYRYIKDSSSVALEGAGVSSPQAAQCKREVIMEVQTETQRILSKYGYTIDDF